MKSIIEDYSYQQCFICGNTYNLELHHCIYGRGWRELSDKYGLTVTLCHKCHDTVHFSTNTDKRRHYDETLKRTAQRAFEKVYKDISFINVFGKNYL